MANTTPQMAGPSLDELVVFAHGISPQMHGGLRSKRTGTSAPMMSDRAPTRPPLPSGEWRLSGRLTVRWVQAPIIVYWAA
jgi:hypothetical protein